jgi:Mrp family chromosome partitioning ATPase
MVDLTVEMGSLWAALGPAPADRGRVIQFVSATGGEGTSTVAREFARLAAVRGRKPAWLVDADLENQSQMAAINAEPDRFGRLGRAAGASPDGSIFFGVRPAARDAEGRPIGDANLLAARPALGTRLWVTRLRLDLLGRAPNPVIVPSGAYWEALRRHADYIVVDSPAADRSDTALALAPFVDATVLVITADQTEASAVAALRDLIEGAGGEVAGLVLNRARATTPKLFKPHLNKRRVS